MLVKLRQEIAALRENKDVGKTSKSFMSDIDQYVEILDKLLVYYTELVEAVDGD